MSYCRKEEDGKDILLFVEKEEEEVKKKEQQESSTTEESTEEPTSTEDQAQQAYNPETGEINWDCPCIAGMTAPPCGDTFKAAFSCFVYSTTEPKGMDCVDQFREMQACFREHPEVYGEELAGGEDDEGDEDNESNESHESKEEEKEGSN